MGAATVALFVVVMLYEVLVNGGLPGGEDRLYPAVALQGSVFGSQGDATMGRRHAQSVRWRAAATSAIGIAYTTSLTLPTFGKPNDSTPTAAPVASHTSGPPDMP